MRFITEKMKQLKSKKLDFEIGLNNKACAIVGGVASALGANPLVSYANPTPAPGSASGSADGAAIMTSVSSIAFTMFKYIGFFLLVWGVGQLVLAYRNDDSDSKVRAIMAIACGAALFGLKTLFDGLGISL